MLQSEECGCTSATARGWVAYLSSDPDDAGDKLRVVTYCPPCVLREFDAQARAAATYT